MAAAFSASFVECAPGNSVTIPGTGLTPSGGTTPSFVVDSQGAMQSNSTTIAATFAADGSSVSFVCPDGLCTGTATATAGDGTMATIGLRCVSQYVQASEYIGEGVDTSDLANGELDAVLRRASSYADAFIGGTKRQFQWLERHSYRKSRWIYPYKFPIITVDQLTFVSAPEITTNFNVATDVYIDKSGPTQLGPDNVQILAYAMGNYVLLGALETIGFSANVWELTFTAGYPWLQYPARLRQATIEIATEMLTYRGIQAKGLGGLTRVRHGDQQYDRRQEPFAIPQPAKELLRPFVARRMA